MSEGENWVEQLPEELRDAPFIEGSNSMGEWKQQIKDYASLAGSSIRIPGPDADEKAWEQFNTRLMEKVPGLAPLGDPDDEEQVKHVLYKLGMPAEADKYQLPEGVEMGGEELGNLKAYAHTLGMTQKQFERHVQSLNDQKTQAQQATQEHFEEQHALLKKEWGQAYDERMNEVESFLKTMEAPEDMQQAFEAGKIGADGMRWLHKLAQLGDEDSGSVRSQADGGDRKLTPMEAEAQLQEVEERLFKGDNGRPIHRSDPQFEYLNKRRIELMRAIAA